MNVDDFTKAYLECALWSSTDNSNEQGGNALDGNYGVEDFSSEAIVEAIRDCKSFQEDNKKDLWVATLKLSGVYCDERNGHDFWLTRNRHGAGFWDRGLGGVGERLTNASHVYGEVYISVGKNGQLYFY